MQPGSKRWLATLLCALALSACSGSKGAKSAGGGDGDGKTGDGGTMHGDGSDGNGKPGGDAGLDGGVTTGCRDRDNDGFGNGCVNGPDCDDDNPNLGGYEICDGKDNDCDGKSDELLKDVCEACDDNCMPVPSPDNVSGWVDPSKKDPSDVEDVIIDDEGAITLSRDMAQAHAVWVANSNDGTVSKLDSATNTELARYVSVRLEGLGDLGASTPNPSRTAVDQRFDAYVANRAHSNDDSVGTVSKYANVEADCIDRNMNGTIETSRDLNKDGTISTVPTDGEFLGQDDECILWTVKVGTNKNDANDPGRGSWPRALAVGIAPPDGEVGYVYVGLNGDNGNHAPEACWLDADTGALVGCVATGSFRPYGAAADARGRIWFASREGVRGIGYVDFDTWHPIDNMPQCGSTNAEPYGITVDADNRVYVAHSNCGTEQLFRYDHANNTGANGGWEKASVPGAGTARGVAVDREHVWVALSGSGTNDWDNTGEDRFVEFAITNLAHIETFHMPNGRSAVGIGVSFDGSIWAINRYHGGTSDPFSGDNGVATRLDPTIPDGMPGRWKEHAVGRYPYTYSDFIGFGLNTFADPKGFYRFVLEGCPGAITHWRGVEVNAKTPPMTSVAIRVRSADKKEDLEAAAWVGPFAGTSASFEGKVPDGAYLQVEVDLATNDQSVAPQVFGVDVIRECATIIK